MNILSKYAFFDFCAIFFKKNTKLLLKKVKKYYIMIVITLKHIFERRGIMARRDGETQMFRVPVEKPDQTKVILQEIYSALSERGYNPINQIVGYILSEDPTYITNHKNARALIRRLDRDELLATLLKYYLDV